MATGTPGADRNFDCAVIVVSYRSADDVGRLLHSLEGGVQGLQVHVTVVDNASGDGVELAIAPFHGVQFIQAGSNLGYSGAINVALARVPQAEYLLILNPDVTVEPSVISRLVETARRTGAGAVVPRMLDMDGRLTLSIRNEPSVLRALGEALCGDRLPRRPHWLADLVRDAWVYEGQRAVDWATGAVILLRFDAVREVGPWDERYFLYSEETDYLHRLRATGVDVVFDPGAVVLHEGGGSGTSPQLVALSHVNRVRYIAKWQGKRRAAAMWIAVLLHNALRVHRKGERAAFLALLSRSHRARLPRAPNVRTDGSGGAW